MYAQHCYKPITAGSNWIGADKNCRNMSTGTTLIQIDNDAEMSFLNQFLILNYPTTMTYVWVNIVKYFKLGKCL